ncbi:urease accessory protein UreE [Defluviimonas sp. WL0002]|uniref:Urease accessory protein UreE n=1 Tax=Albidovulum marisflavi TaxID=2984159 RepID=A0ABT2ZC26_9RHOB|nr:urease accessory protein UreE [Defluviimonas sp. WL0002]MCV2868695.1 urease accessory protein UreE [Defluviimonas sp. WL0002]
MLEIPVAQTVDRQCKHGGLALTCTLDYAARFLRRKRLLTDCGLAFLVDLPQTTSLDGGDALVLSDGRHVAILAANEDLLEVCGNLPRLAWHIGNRHTPCQVESDRLLIQHDPVIAHMLEHLGATVRPTRAAFTPEGGAYGHGRTHAHEHGHTAHAH